MLSKGSELGFTNGLLESRMAQPMQATKPSHKQKSPQQASPIQRFVPFLRTQRLRDCLTTTIPAHFVIAFISR